jgi:hypothetical protein
VRHAVVENMSWKLFIHRLIHISILYRIYRQGKKLAFAHDIDHFLRCHYLCFVLHVTWSDLSSTSAYSATIHHTETFERKYTVRSFQEYSFLCERLGTLNKSIQYNLLNSKAADALAIEVRISLLLSPLSDVFTFSCFMYFNLIRKI